MRRRLLLGTLLLAPSAGVRAQAPSPQDFLRSIYEPYRQAGFKGQPYREAGRFFAPDLAQAIEADMKQAGQRKEVPTLDGDPFVDAQEWRIEALAYSGSAAGTKAAGAVSFVNGGEPKGLALTMIQTPDGWRIHDIVGANGSLRALFKLR